MRTVHATYQERAHLRRGGHRRLDTAFRECARLYNAALEHWQSAWKHGDSVTLYEQHRELTAVRADDPYWGRVSVKVGRGVLRRLDRARRAFYRRCKRGEKPGYPRFRAARRWRTIEVDNPSRSMVTNSRGKWVVKVKGLPVLVLRPRRQLPDPRNLKSLTITRKPSGVHVSLGYEVERQSLSPTGRSVGLDMGVHNRVALSDGGFVARRQTDAKRIAELQQRAARCRRGSNNQRKLYAQLARLKHREAARNRNDCHRISTDVVRRYDHIAVENLAVARMTHSARGSVERPGRNVRAKAGLNRSVLEQSWGLLISQLEYKARWYGRSIAAVDPSYTSRTCSTCGVVDATNRKGSIYECGSCGSRMDADTNAALNVLARSLSATGAGTPPGLAAA